MTLSVDEVRAFFRDFDLAYKDSEVIDEEWSVNFYFPIKGYNFDGREGLRTDVHLKKVFNDDIPDFDYLGMDIFGVYHTTDMSLLIPLHKRINLINLRTYYCKWCLTTGQNSDGIDEIQIHINLEVALDGDGTLTSSQFWRSHASIWHSITRSWNEFSEILGIMTPKKDLGTVQQLPENIADLNKEQVLELFDNFLNEKFDNV
jgi:hypothetical protein